MIGIKAIGFYIPEKRESNFEKLNRHNVTSSFIEDKIGIASVSRKGDLESTSDLCVKAYQSLNEEVKVLRHQDIDFICVCTENGDYLLPFTAAIVQDKLGISSQCAAFDINLGCSGYVYALRLSKNFMEANGLRKGILFTADPYSGIISENDRNTDLLFGDAATATLLTDEPILDICEGVFETFGSEHMKLIKRPNAPLYMDGRSIFNFAMRNVPQNLEKCLRKNKITMDNVDMWLFHQASLFIIKNIIKILKLDSQKVPFNIREYGNTVSSTIPLLLKDYLFSSNNIIFMSGFGVGLSLASIIARRVNSQ
jgi:3-oxoacyl-[acyl-carrier-protein] synthase-3